MTSLLSVYQPFVVAATHVLGVWLVLCWAAHKLFDVATPSPMGGGRDDD